jgi:hypothetical protein
VRALYHGREVQLGIDAYAIVGKSGDGLHVLTAVSQIAPQHGPILPQLHQPSTCRVLCGYALDEPKALLALSDLGILITVHFESDTSPPPNSVIDLEYFERRRGSGARATTRWTFAQLSGPGLTFVDEGLVHEAALIDDLLTIWDMPIDTMVNVHASFHDGVLTVESGMSVRLLRCGGQAGEMPPTPGLCDIFFLRTCRDVGTLALCTTPLTYFDNLSDRVPRMTRLLWFDARNSRSLRLDGIRDGRSLPYSQHSSVQVVSCVIIDLEINAVHDGIIDGSCILADPSGWVRASFAQTHWFRQPPPDTMEIVQRAFTNSFHRVWVRLLLQCNFHEDGTLSCEIHGIRGEPQTHSRAIIAERLSAFHHGRIRQIVPHIELEAETLDLADHDFGLV